MTEYQEKQERNLKIKECGPSDAQALEAGSSSELPVVESRETAPESEKSRMVKAECGVCGSKHFIPLDAWCADFLCGVCSKRAAVPTKTNWKQVAVQSLLGGSGAILALSLIDVFKFDGPDLLLAKWSMGISLAITILGYVLVILNYPKYSGVLGKIDEQLKKSYLDGAVRIGLILFSAIGITYLVTFIVLKLIQTSLFV